MIGLIVLILALFAVFHSSSPAKVALTVFPDQATYNVGEAINLTLRLSNVGDTPTCVSAMSAGSVRFASFTRNDAPTATRSAPSYFIESLPDMLAASLVPLGPGESLDISLTSDVDGGLGTHALRTTALDNGRGITTFYDVGTPGTYAIDAFYEYTGEASSACPNVFRGRTPNTRVTFTVTSQHQ